MRLSTASYLAIFLFYGKGGSIGYSVLCCTLMETCGGCVAFNTEPLQRRSPKGFDKKRQAIESRLRESDAQAYEGQTQVFYEKTSELSGALQY